VSVPPPVAYCSFESVAWLKAYYSSNGHTAIVGVERSSSAPLGALCLFCLIVPA